MPKIFTKKKCISVSSTVWTVFEEATIYNVFKKLYALICLKTN